MNFIQKEYDYKKSLMPLVIGITGHRDLRKEDIIKLESKVEEILVDLRKSYSNTHFIFISPLAEGADRLGAKVFLKLNESYPNFNGTLVVPLPMEKEEYIKDFKTEESKKEFDILLSKAKYIFELPYVKEKATENMNRKHQYEQVGEYIANNSEILIALWDGRESEAIGGTSKIVQYKLRGKGLTREYFEHSENILDSKDTGPVYHIITPRMSNPINEKDNAFQIDKKYPLCHSYDDDAENVYNEIFTNLDNYNLDIKLNKNELNKKIKDSIGNVINDQDYRNLTKSSKKILYKYAAADLLSIKYQKKYKGILLLMFGTGFITVLSYLIYGDLITRNYLLGIYILSLMIAGGMYCFATYKTKIQSKYLDYRALSEGLRIKFFWNIVGIKKETGEYYLEKQKGELEWIRNAIKGCSLESYLDLEIAKKNRSENFLLVHNNWIKNQREYYAQKTSHDKDYKKLIKHEKIVKVLFLLNVLMIGSMFFVQILDEDIKNQILTIDKINFQITLDSFIKFLSGVIILIISILNGFNQKKSVMQNVRRYSKMKGFYSNASKRMVELSSENGSDKLDKMEKLIFEIGKEALDENADWLLLQREQTPEVIF